MAAPEPPRSDLLGVRDVESAKPHIMRLARARGGDLPSAIAAARQIVEQVPGCPEAKKLLAALLARQNPDCPRGATERLALLRAALSEKPRDVEAILAYAALLHKIQLARANAGTHPEGSLCDEIAALCGRALRVNPHDLEALRIFSAQLRLRGEFSLARTAITNATVKLLHYIRNALHPPETVQRLPPVTARAVDVSPEDLIELLGAGRLVGAPEHAPKIRMARNWISFCRIDRAFIDISEAEQLLGEPDTAGRELAEQMLQRAETGLHTALRIYPDTPTPLLGLAKIAALRGAHEQCVALLLRSHAIEPTGTVLSELKKRGVEPPKNESG